MAALAADADLFFDAGGIAIVVENFVKRISLATSSASYFFKKL